MPWTGMCWAYWVAASAAVAPSSVGDERAAERPQLVLERGDDLGAERREQQAAVAVVLGRVGRDRAASAGGTASGRATETQTDEKCSVSWAICVTASIVTGMNARP